MAVRSKTQQYRLNVGPVYDADPTLSQHLINISCNKMHSHNFGSILGERRMHWTTIDPTMGQRLVFARMMKVTD